MATGAVQAVRSIVNPAKLAHLVVHPTGGTATFAAHLVAPLEVTVANLAIETFLPAVLAEASLPVRTLR